MRGGLLMAGKRPRLGRLVARQTRRPWRPEGHSVVEETAWDNGGPAYVYRFRCQCGRDAYGLSPEEAQADHRARHRR